MNRPSRPWNRSPVLRWLAAFAWLWLVVLPVHGQGMAMCGLAPGASHASACASMQPALAMRVLMASAMHTHHAATSTTANIGVIPADDCCHGGHHQSPASGCHCAAMTGGVLVGIGGIEPLLSWVGVDAYPLLSETSAPDIAAGPPLRPPAA